jgi:hypothetical protein
MTEFQALVDRCGGRCQVCKKELVFRAARHRDKPVVDHCHQTGRVRGILCNPCNTALGLLGDSADNLQRGIEYLKENHV